MKSSFEVQRGVVLLVALVLLLVLTVTGLSAMRLTSVEERMTANFSDRNIAFQSAEAALRDAEQFLDGKDYQLENLYTDCSANECFNKNCTNGLCFNGTFASTDPTTCEIVPITNAEDEIFQNAANWADGSGKYIEASLDLDGTGGIPKAKYMIEFSCFVLLDAVNSGPRYDPVFWEPIYRITALGSGRNPNTRVMLQSTYRKN